MVENTVHYYIIMYVNATLKKDICTQSLRDYLITY